MQQLAEAARAKQEQKEEEQRAEEAKYVMNNSELVCICISYQLYDITA